MFPLKDKHIFVWLLIVSFISFTVFYIYMTRLADDVPGLRKIAVGPALPRIIGPEEQVVISETFEICRRHGLTCAGKEPLEGPDREGLNGLTEAELKVRFPEESGWTISWKDHELILEHSQPGLCQEHRKRWHLEADESNEKAAIYLGPSGVGKDGGLVSATDIYLSKLPGELQERIKNGTIEFLEWDDLIATLDSLAE